MSNSVPVTSASLALEVGGFTASSVTVVLESSPAGWSFTYGGCVENHDAYGAPGGGYFPTRAAALAAALDPALDGFETLDD